ncbi:hypothetical protein BDV96DRAFT_490237 [Lophiotrema nucula]|uniref:Threonine/serine exporter-like N-terminal domain-containing protein n=1 Tax=Lophiotrema nucula TaxID=690887 RepID=A0A6A5ZE16_9PLEO|nr:hypothetical protein BDV96DRAFT_490237 [Lophiotrema nucula]
MAPGGRKRVGFTPDVASFPKWPEEILESGSGEVTPLPLRSDVSHEELSEELHRAFGQPYVPKPRPAIRRTPRTPPQFHLDVDDVDESDEKRRSGIEAQQRATRLSRSVGTFSASAPGSRRNSNDRLIGTPPVIDIPLRDMGYDVAGEATDEEDEGASSHARKDFLDQADRLLRHHTTRLAPNIRPEDLYHSQAVTPLHSGQVTPMNELEVEAEHVSRPPKYRTGVLGTLLRATTAAQTSPPAGRNTKITGHGKNPSSGSITFSGASTAANSPTSSTSTSGATTPLHPSSRHWYSRSANASTTSISKLLETSHMLATPGQKDFGQQMGEKYKKTRPGMSPRTRSDNSIKSALGKLGKPKNSQFKIQVHLAGTLARQNYLRKLCKALMMYGAPTHRLEEYMNMSARVLEIEAQFLYIPGCMIISFDDSSVHTTEVKLVRTNQGVDLGKLRDVHEIYKDVVHDRIGVEEATPRLAAIMDRKQKYSNWLRVFVYGLASATVGPFAFEARPIDLPFCFILGCLIGWLQLIIAPQNELITNVFEIGAAVITSFIARGLGSITRDGKEIFCFSAMAQSSIALILPGFTVLCASLELQSRHIVAGSVRMVYAIIYSLFLGYGITIGTVIFGLMYKDATSATSCSNPMNSHWYYFFVVAFSLCLMVINQAKYKQIPAMTVIALIGYVVNFHSSKYFTGNAQVSNTLGALAIGIAANAHARFGRYVENWSLDIWEHTLRPRIVRLRKRWLRSRHGPRGGDSHLWPSGGNTSRASSVASEYVPKERKIGYGLAAAAMLPAIFVQVPSGLSVNGSLVSGVTSADQIVRNTTNYTTVSTASEAYSNGTNSVALTVGFSVIQVAIGITVGLFLAALFVYPLGKRRSGLFSF